MSPDDYTSDPDSGATGVPGTTDDVPASYGEDLPEPSDDSGPRASGAASEDDANAVSATDEGDLWRRQKALIEEDEKEGLRVGGFSEEEIPVVLEAMGDDAADPLDDAPNGTSATGLWSTPDHGGFPERSE